MTDCYLRGIAWNHSRALPPLVATAQRYEELNPGVRIVWEKRTLHEFGHASLAQLAAKYDLLVIDHPMMGEAAESLVDLRRCLTPIEVRSLRELYVGPSFESYEYRGGLYALPIDAAAPAASFRPDLLKQAGLTTPSDWKGVLQLARLGQVRMPGFPADLFLNWMGMCISQGSPCAADPEHLFHRDVASYCIEELRALAAWMPDSIYGWNPIALYEAMAATDEFAYCPFAYTYSNYSRRGFAANVLEFGQPVHLAQGTAMQTVLGGTGIAISKKSAWTDHALRYSLFVADPTVQRDLYGLAGGQPAARAAWDDPALDWLNYGFFSGTRASIENAYVRPRHRGYIPLQEQGGTYVAQYLKGQIAVTAALDAIDRLYRESLHPRGHAQGVEEEPPHA